MGRSIGRLVNACLRQVENMKQEQLAAERAEREQAQRVADFQMRMGAVAEAAVEGMHKGRRILRVNPTPHPSDEGMKPLMTNWPQPNQRIMPRGTHMAVMR